MDGGDPELLRQLRQVLLSAEQQTFDLQSKQRRVEDDEARISRLQRDVTAREAEVGETTAKLKEVHQFSAQQQEHICRLQKCVEEEKKRKSSFNGAIESMQSRVDALTGQLEEREQDAKRLRERVDGLAGEKALAEEQASESQVALEQFKQASTARVNDLRKKVVALHAVAKEKDEEARASGKGSVRLQTALEKVCKTRDELAAQAEAQLEKMVALQDQVGHEQKKRAELKTESEEALKAHRARSKQAQARADELEATASGLQQALDKLKEDNGFHVAQGHHVQGKLEALKREMASKELHCQDQVAQGRQSLDQLNKLRLAEAHEARNLLAEEVLAGKSRLRALQERLDASEAQASALRAHGELEKRELCASNERLQACAAQLAEAEVAAADAHSQARAQEARAKDLERTGQEQARTLRGALDAAKAEAAALLDRVRAQAAKCADAEQGKLSAAAQWEDEKAHLATQAQARDEAALALEARLEATAGARALADAEVETLSRRVCEQEARLREREEIAAADEAQRAENKVEAEKWEAAMEKRMEARKDELSKLKRCNVSVLQELAEAKQLFEREKAALDAERAAERAAERQQSEETLAASVGEEAQRASALEGELQRQQRDAAAQLKALRVENAELRDVVREEQGARGDANRRGATLEDQLRNLQQRAATQVVESNQKARDLYAENEALRNDVAEQKARSRLLKGNEEEATKLVTQLRQEQEQLRKQARVDVAEVQSALDVARRDKGALDVALVQQQLQAAEAQQKLRAEADTEREELRNAMDGVRWKADGLQRQLSDRESEKLKLDHRSRALEVENQSLKDTNAQLMVLYRSMSSNANNKGSSSIANNNNSSKERDVQELQSTASKRQHLKPIRKERRAPPRNMPDFIRQQRDKRAELDSLDSGKRVTSDFDARVER